LDKGLAAQDILFDLPIPVKRFYIAGEEEKVEEIVVDKGLLVLCFRTQFFPYKNSLYSLNIKNFNPAAVLGAWHLGGEWE